MLRGERLACEAGVDHARTFARAPRSSRSTIADLDAIRRGGARSRSASTNSRTRASSVRARMPAPRSRAQIALDLNDLILRESGDPLERHRELIRRHLVPSGSSSVSASRPLTTPEERSSVHTRTACEQRAAIAGAIAHQRHRAIHEHRDDDLALDAAAHAPCSLSISTCTTSALMWRDPPHTPRRSPLSRRCRRYRTARLRRRHAISACACSEQLAAREDPAARALRRSALHHRARNLEQRGGKGVDRTAVDTREHRRDLRRRAKDADAPHSSARSSAERPSLEFGNRVENRDAISGHRMPTARRDRVFTRYLSIDHARAS